MTKQRHFDSLIQLMSAIPDEQAAIDHFTAIRWKDGAFCPLCGSTRVYHFSDSRTHKCGDCRKRFSIKVGTIFEDSKIGMRSWMMAVWLITSHKKGIASTQLAKDIGVTQKTAWFMLHRLRHAAQTRSFKGLKSQNLRDHMTDMELILTMLGETSTKEIAVKRDAQGLYSNAQAARAGGDIAGSARKQIEQQTGDKVVSSQNFLGNKRAADPQLPHVKKGA